MLVAGIVVDVDGDGAEGGDFGGEGGEEGVVLSVGKGLVGGEGDKGRAAGRTARGRRRRT